MIHTHLLLASLLLVPVITHAQETKLGEARDLAQRLVDKNTAFVDAEDYAALLASYTEDANISLVCKDPDTGDYMTAVRDHSGSIWQMYRDLHSGLLPENGPKKIASKSTVEYANMIEPDLLVIHGYFQPYRDEDMRWPFIQVRRKLGDEWRIMSQRVFMKGERAVMWSRIQVQNKTRK